MCRCFLCFKVCERITLAAYCCYTWIYNIDCRTSTHCLNEFVECLTKINLDAKNRYNRDIEFLIDKAPECAHRPARNALQVSMRCEWHKVCSVNIWFLGALWPPEIYAPGVVQIYGATHTSAGGIGPENLRGERRVFVVCRNIYIYFSVFFIN